MNSIEIFSFNKLAGFRIRILEPNWNKDIWNKEALAKNEFCDRGSKTQTQLFELIGFSYKFRDDLEHKQVWLSKDEYVRI